MDSAAVFFAIIGILYLLAMPVAVIVLIVRSVQTRKLIKELEDAVMALRRRLPPAAAQPQVEAPPEIESPETQPPALETPEAQPPEIAAVAFEPPAETVSAPPPANEPARPAARDFESLIAGGWFVWIAAAALVLGGVFLVREAIEQGWLTPGMRVLCGAALGAALIAAAEWLREPDEAERQGLFQAPAALAVGGVSALFAAILAARHLYGLAGPELGFGAMALVSALAMGLGWRHGPVLAGAGLLGGYLTPMLVGGQPEGSAWLFAYILLLTAACYGVERLKRWGWVAWSATAAALVWGLALIQGFDAGAFRIETAVSVAVFAPALAAIAAILPGYGLRLASDEQGTALTGLVQRHVASVTALLALAATAVAAILLLVAALATDAILILSLGFAALSAFAILALHRLGALDEAAPIALAGASAALLLTGPALGYWTPRAPELIDRSALVPLLFVTALFAALTLGGADWRARRSERPLLWAAVGAFGPAALFFSLYLGRWDVYPPAWWALGALAVATAQTLQAGRSPKRQAAVFALAALGSIAGAAGIVQTGAPLSLAFATLAAAAALIERRFDMAPLAWAATAAAILLGARLLVWPGIDAALDMTAWEMALAYLPAAAGCALAASVLARDATSWSRVSARVVTESAALLFLAVYLSLVVRRAFLPDTDADFPDTASPAEFGLYVWVWGLAALTQLYRAGLGGVMRIPRLALATLAGLASGASLLALALPFNPVETGSLVDGPPILDSLAFAYLGGAALLAAGAWMTVRAGWTHIATGLGLLAGGSGLLWAGLEIRRLWRGRDLSVPDVLDGELYSYSIALLILSALAVIGGSLAHWRTARLAGLALAGAAVAKAFLIDMADLGGLWKAGSFIALGLLLVGLAWLYRKLEPSSGRDASVG